MATNFPYIMKEDQFFDFESALDPLSSSAFYDYEDLPPHVIEALSHYIHRGWEPGGFVTSVLAGDLFRAANNADVANRQALWEVTRFIMHKMPQGSWGNYDRVNKWLADTDGIRTQYNRAYEQWKMWQILKERGQNDIA